MITKSPAAISRAVDHIDIRKNVAVVKETRIWNVIIVNVEVEDQTAMENLRRENCSHD